MLDSKIDRIFSSPMVRAQETAEPACTLLSPEKQIEKWTHEIGKEKLTTFPDGKRKSITMVQNIYYRENGNIYFPYEKLFDCVSIKES